MATLLGALRSRLLAPSMSGVSARGRGFPRSAGTVTASPLDAVPQAVVLGFEWGISGADVTELDQRVALVAPPLQGFAYEGVVMAATLLDVMPGPGGRVRRLLQGPAAEHLFLAYIGIGFAMARVPRRLWADVVPDLPESAYHPVMSWLAVDGYAFDRAYFDTRVVVGEQRRLPRYPWDGDPEYFGRVCDQGTGRALWFVHGARVDDVARAVEAFAEGRRADLWSGVGLAACFAAGADVAALEALAREAGVHRGDLAVGAVFAAKARSHAGETPESTARAVATITGLDVVRADRLADDCRPPHTDAGRPGAPVYELWRRSIREAVERARLRPTGSRPGRS